MERLTKKFDVCENYSYYSTQDNEYTSPLVDKLGKYEDNDEYFGIDYNILTQVFEKGIWVVEAIWPDGKKLIYHYEDVCLMKNEYGVLKLFACPLDIWDESVELKDYGEKTRGGWALTKEELL